MTVEPLAVPDQDRTVPIVVYALFLAGWLGGLSAPAGCIVAYVVRGRAAPWAQTHYTFLIRTFWIAFLWLIIAGFLIVLGIPLTLILIGILFWKLGLAITGLVSLWVTVRCIVGLSLAVQGQAYPRPRAWLI